MHGERRFVYYMKAPPRHTRVPYIIVFVRYPHALALATNSFPPSPLPVSTYPLPDGKYSVYSSSLFIARVSKKRPWSMYASTIFRPGGLSFLRHTQDHM